MPGDRQKENQSHLIWPLAYRTGLTGTDVTGPTGGATAAAGDLTGPNWHTNTISTITCTNSRYAAEMHLNIYAALHGSGSATLEVWVNSPVGEAGSTSLAAWFLLHSTTVSHGGEVIQLTNAPPGLYKILVTSLSANNELDIYYQFRK